MTSINNSIDIQNQYLSEAARYPLLSAEEELALGKLIHDGQVAQSELDSESTNMDSDKQKELYSKVVAGKSAKNQFVNSNLRLVASCAKKALGNGLSYLDLIQEGNIGLMTAVDKYDYRKGNRFATYGTYWIKQAISRAIQKHGRSVHLPIHVVEKIRKMKKVEQTLSVEKGKTPTDKELAFEMGLDIQEIISLKTYSVSVDSLNIPIDKDSNEGIEKGDMLFDKNSHSQEEAVANSLIIDKLSTMLNDLSEQERYVVIKRFGIGCDVKTLEALGKEFGVSRERIRQILKKAISKLRKASSESGLKDLWGSGQDIFEE